MKRIYPHVLIGFCAAFLFGAVSAQTIQGAGSTAAAPIYQIWAAGYQKVTNTVLEYEAIGSSAGLKKMRDLGTDFGATDVAPSASELAQSNLLVFPIAITGVAPVFNLPGLPDAALRLDGTTLARVLMGEIKWWDDPSLKQLNPDLKLPRLPVKVIVRSDGSGTTYNFTDYLSKVNPTWAKQWGAKTVIDWPETFVPAKGSEGVAKAVSSTVGALGYVDYSYLISYKLKAAMLKNAQGRYVSVTKEALSSALQKSDWMRSQSFTSTLTNQAGDASWPITMATFALLPKTTKRPKETAQAIDFFLWALLSGDRLVDKNHFVHLPAPTQALAFKIIHSIRDEAGLPLPMKLRL